MVDSKSSTSDHQLQMTFDQHLKRAPFVVVHLSFSGSFVISFVPPVLPTLFSINLAGGFSVTQKRNSCNYNIHLLQKLIAVTLVLVQLLSELTNYPWLVRLVGRLVGWLVGWQVGWLAGWLVGRLAGWQVG